MHGGRVGHTGGYTGRHGRGLMRKLRQLRAGYIGRLYRPEGGQLY